MGGASTKEKRGVSLENQNFALINNKYKLISIIGGGAFGQVYKVLDTKNKCFYAMKVVPFANKDKKIPKKQQMMIIKSAETEKTLLSKFDHPNIVKLYSSFIIDRNPLEAIGSPRKAHLCILLEYIPGSDLNYLLQLCEEEESKEEITSTSSSRIPRDLTIHWFVKLVETLNYVHSKKVIHRDLKPDNILVSYLDIQDYRKMNLKISDFGVGKEISSNELGKTISGQLFYTAPEVLKQSDKGYDSRCDIWSLGIILLQVFAKISIKTYQRAVHEIFKRIKKTPELNRRFCKRYGLKDMDNVTLLPLLVFMHENDLFYVIIENFIEDPGVCKVLNNMICPYEQRLFSEDLLETPIVKTWKYILNLSPKMDKNDFDVLGILTFLPIPDQIIFTRCLDLLTENILIDVNAFVDNDGIKIMFERISKMKDLFKKRFLKTITFLLMKILLHYKYKDEKRYKTCIRRITCYFREFLCMAAFKAVILQQNSITIYYFTFIMCLHCQSIRYHLMDMVKPFILKINDTNRKYLIALIKTVVPHLPLKDTQDIIGLYKSNELYFLRKVKYKNEIADEVIRRIYRQLKDLKPNQTTKKEENLLLLTFFLQDYDKFQIEKTDLKLHHNKFPSAKAKIKLKDSSQKENVQIHSSISKRLFSCNFNEKKLFVELTSSEPISEFYKFSPQGEEEVAIGYYELFIKNGGTIDDLFFGLTTFGKQILLHCESGTIGVFNVKRNDITQFKYRSMLCFTGYYIGVGLTNKGNVFYTYDGKLITPFVEFITPTLIGSKYRGNLDKNVFALMKLNGNKFFKGHVNFGKRKFNFNFKEVKPCLEKKKKIETNVFVNTVKAIMKQDKNFAYLKHEQQTSEKDSFVYLLCSKILYTLGESVEKIDVDDDLVEIYNEDGTDLIEKAFEESDHLKEDSNEQLSVRENLFKKYQGLQQSQKERADKGDLEKKHNSIDENKSKKKKGGSGIFDAMSSKRKESVEDLLFGMIPRDVPSYMKTKTSPKSSSFSDDIDRIESSRDAHDEPEPKKKKKSRILDIVKSKRRGGVEELLFGRLSEKNKEQARTPRGKQSPTIFENTSPKGSEDVISKVKSTQTRKRRGSITKFFTKKPKSELEKGFRKRRIVLDDTDDDDDD